MNISNQLKQADKLAAKAGRVICNALNGAYKCDQSDQHTYYVHNHKLYISYPSSYYAMDRQVTQNDIVRALDGLDGDSSVEVISQAIVNYFAI